MAEKTVKLYATACASLSFDEKDKNNHTLTQTNRDDLLLKFDPPLDMIYGMIMKVELYIYVSGRIWGSGSDELYFEALQEDWDQNTATWNNAPSYYKQSQKSYYYSAEKFGEYVSAGWTNYEAAGAYAIQYGLRLSDKATKYRYYTSNASPAYRPYIEVTYEADSMSIYGPNSKITKPEPTDSSGRYYAMPTEIDSFSGVDIWGRLVTRNEDRYFVPFLTKPSIKKIELMRDGAVAYIWDDLNITSRAFVVTLPQGEIKPDKHDVWGNRNTWLRLTTKDDVIIGRDALDDVKYHMFRPLPKPENATYWPNRTYLDRTQDIRLPISFRQCSGYQKGKYELPYESIIIAEDCTADWRVDGTEERHPITIETEIRSSAKWFTLLIPANTLPQKSDIDISINVTSEYGNVWSVWIREDDTEAYDSWPYTTSEAMPVCTARYPDGIPIDTSKDIRLQWTHEIKTGTLQTAAEIQYSIDGTSWIDLAHVDGPENEYDVPGGTLPAGTIYWRVRSYNRDDIPSEWSNVLSFISIRAPEPPVVTVTNSSPRPVIQWEGSGQEAYEVYVGDLSSGTTYGNMQRWRSPVLLEPGSYYVRVRIQNEYGLWSEFGETTLSVVNTPPGEIVLLGEADDQSDVKLSWTAVRADSYVIYRNGKAIAQTTERTYTDDGAVGTCRYFVRSVSEENGNYAESNPVEITVVPDTIMIKAEGIGTWTRLKYAETAAREYVKSAHATGTIYHVSGRRDPVAALTEYRSCSMQITAAFMHEDPAAAALEDMLGMIVVIKTPKMEMVRGPLLSFDRKTNQFYKAYAFSVTNTEVEEEIGLGT